MLRLFFKALVVVFHGALLGGIVLIALGFDLIKSPFVTLLLIFGFSAGYIILWVFSAWGLGRITRSGFKDALRADAYFYAITWFLVLMLPSLLVFARWSVSQVIFGFLAIFILGKLVVFLNLSLRKEGARTFIRLLYYSCICALYASLVFIISFDARFVQGQKYAPTLLMTLGYAFILQLFVHEIMVKKFQLKGRFKALVILAGFAAALPFFRVGAAVGEVMVKEGGKGWHKARGTTIGPPTFTPLTVKIKGNSRKAFILPVNHSLTRNFTVSENQELRFSVGVMNAPGINTGYQLGVFAMDAQFNKHRLAIQYIERNESRWHNLRIELDRFSGQKIKVLLQTTTWAPDNSTPFDGEDKSYIFITEPRIVNSRGRGDYNVVFILADALRADHLSTYGYKYKTDPYFLELAGGPGAVLFENAISHTSWTAPSVASIFTSMMPCEHGVKSSYSMRLKNYNHTIAEVLRDEGYFTKAISANPHVSMATLFDQGFMSFEEIPAKYMVYGSTGMVVADALGWLDERRNTDPFFLYVHFIDPHDPYIAPKPFTFRSGKTDWGKTWQTFFSVFLHPSGYDFFGIAQTRTVYPSQLESMKDRYDGEIKYIDQAIRRIIDKLKEQNLMGRTLVVITSDHGEEFMEHGSIKHGFALYQESIHVPLLFLFPDRSLAGKRVETFVPSLDIAPTILDFLKISQPDAFRGESLLPVINGGELSGQFIISELYVPFVETMRSVSIISNNYKLIKFYEATRKVDMSFYGDMELFDLQKDPGEKFNLIQERPRMAAELEGEIIDHLKVHETLSDGSGMGKLDKETIEKLRALGYIK